jgi:hypothetical protein
MSTRARVIGAVTSAMMLAAGAARADEVPGERDPVHAGILSIGVPLAGVALVTVASKIDSGPIGAVGGAAIVIGPSLGHIYAGTPWNTGLKMRVAGLGVGVVAGLMFMGAESGEVFCTGSKCEAGIALGVAAIGLYGVGTVYEMFSAPAAVQRYNATLTVAPLPTGTGLAPGAVFGGHF